RNTKTAEKDFLAPALETTLIGGFVEPAGAGICRVAVICVGDGAIELVRSNGAVTQCLWTDPEVMAIGAAVGPGPRARQSLDSPAVSLKEVNLESGERLLISSDGLARGHSQPVWQKMEELLPDFSSMLYGKTQAAKEILSRLAGIADLQQGNLFNDNLSLIILGAA